ncbi:unnamed protein product [Adineta ricciae]|uniref:Ubiquitin carboxyl-terminal hydrolase n=1 Tax=Adineta ricciae TaxID=249248 RepID=A0A813TH51_ADIRI|nr:unnamed protein product [Adineta ricciae]CAF1017089.1 unnamed protein product [Adineta ricciae]
MSATTDEVCFRVCRIYRDLFYLKYIWVPGTTTIQRLKEEICVQLCLAIASTDVTLTLFDKTKNVWIPIDETNINRTITDFQYPCFSILNVENHKKIKENPNLTSDIRNNDFKLRLCKRPMDRSDLIDLFLPSTMTINQLKKEMRTHVTTGRTNHLYVWMNHSWTKYELNLDDVTLAELDFVPRTIISFEPEVDLVPGVCGLTNLGNTCFMNSALQCLSNIPEFTQQILSFNDEMNAPIIGAYSQLIKMIWSGDYAVATPSSLLIDVRECLPRYSSYKQHDAQEFMNYFLHLIHQELTNSVTLITDLFYGQIRSTIRCSGGCGSAEINEENFSFLPLPVEDDSDQYHVLYLKSNGEQAVITFQSSTRTIGGLVESFIEHCKLNVPAQRIQAVQIINNRIVKKFQSDDSLRSTIKHQMAFIELQEKSVDQKYMEFQFLDRKTYVPFRPPVYIIRPLFGCHYSDLSQQIQQIQQHLSLATNALPDALNNLYWISDSNSVNRLTLNSDRNEPFLFLHHITIEMDLSWIQQYQKRYKLDLPQNNLSLNDLLTSFFREDPLNGDYYCSHCQILQKARQKSDLLLPLPRVLIIQLKRFTYEAYSNRKIDTYIDFPLENLDLSPYVTSDNINQNITSSSLYDLVAVSNHTGTLFSGHYTTYAKNSRNYSWYSFNDETTRQITDVREVVTKNAYILVYVKRTVA